MIAYFFHFCQSDFRDLWGHGEVGWLAAKKSAGRQRISPTSPFTLPFSPAPWRGGSEFQPLPPFALPFRLLAGFKGNGFRRVSLFTLPFSPAPWRGGSEFQPLPPFTLPFRPRPQKRIFSPNPLYPRPRCGTIQGIIVLQYRVSSYVSRHACMTGEHRLRHSCKALEWRFNCE